MEYAPYGETWVEEESDQMEYIAYKYTSKELDEETGMYYFGARYLDPLTSGWMSPDPILGSYLPTGNKEKDNNLPGQGGVFNPLNLNLYHYAGNNPIRLTDPNGLETKEGNACYISAYSPAWYNNIPIVKDVTKEVGDIVMTFTGSDMNPITREIYLPGDRFDAAWSSVMGNVAFALGGYAIGASSLGVKVTGWLQKQFASTMAKITNFCENWAANKSVAVLGKFPGYLETARKFGLSRFNVGKYWDQLVKSGIDPWTYNERFLDKIAKKGGEFIINDPNNITGYLLKEVNYLKTKYNYKEVTVNGVTKLVK